MDDLEKLFAKYDYDFPENLIGQKPVHPRDSARLIVYNRKLKKTTFDTFSNFASHLPKNSVLVLNQTKVVPARFTVTKTTGGKVNLLYIKHDKKFVYALSDKKLAIGSKVTLDHYQLEIFQKTGSEYWLKPSFDTSNTFKILQRFGRTPIPHYIKHSPLTEKQLSKEYQTVFAKTPGSVAAPTASLHFTKKLLKKIKSLGIEIEYITLHVNLGTFATLTEGQVKKNKLHVEYYEISKPVAKRLNLAKKHNKKIVAVGTTVVRTLESAVKNKRLTKLSGSTDLFIHEPYTFKFVDCISTNFHVPKSSLLMLVSAFTGRTKTLDLYQKAIQKKFRLFSFGDGMLIL